MNITELEKFVLLLREGLNENIKVFSSDLDYLTKNYSVVVNDLTTVMQKLEDFIIRQNKVNDNLKSALLQLKKEPGKSNKKTKESMFKDLRDLKNTPKSKNIKIIKKEPVKSNKKQVKKEKKK